MRRSGIESIFFWISTGLDLAEITYVKLWKQHRLEEEMEKVSSSSWSYCTSTAPLLSKQELIDQGCSVVDFLQTGPLWDIKYFRDKAKDISKNITTTPNSIKYRFSFPIFCVKRYIAKCLLPHKISLNGDKDWILSAVLFICQEQIFDRFYADVSQSTWASVVNSILNSFTAPPSVWSLFHCHINSCLILKKKYFNIVLTMTSKVLHFREEWLYGFKKKIIFQHTIMAHETPPPLHGKCHLKYPYFPNWFEMMIRI